MRTPRKQSANDIYHVVTRGTGRQIIFEGDGDRKLFLTLLDDARKRYGAELYAWCLMSNHVHILVHVPMDRLALMMKHLLSSYAEQFNSKSGRSGHLFQERYKSEPVDSDSYFLNVIRYIHQNPEIAELDATDTYAWSSYREYLQAPHLCATTFPLSIFGGAESFVAFHQVRGKKSCCLDVDDTPARNRTMPDDMALGVALAVLDGFPVNDIKTLPPTERNKKLRALRCKGLSIRQIERLTGIGRGIISRV